MSVKFRNLFLFYLILSNEYNTLILKVKQGDPIQHEKKSKEEERKLGGKYRYTPSPVDIPSRSSKATGPGYDDSQEDDQEADTAVLKKFFLWGLFIFLFIYMSNAKKDCDALKTQSATQGLKHKSKKTSKRHKHHVKKRNLSMKTPSFKAMKKIMSEVKKFIKHPKSINKHSKGLTHKIRMNLKKYGFIKEKFNKVFNKKLLGKIGSHKKRSERKLIYGYNLGAFLLIVVTFFFGVSVAKFLIDMVMPCPYRKTIQPNGKFKIVMTKDNNKKQVKKRKLESKLQKKLDSQAKFLLQNKSILKNKKYASKKGIRKLIKKMGINMKIDDKLFGNIWRLFKKHKENS